MVTVVRRYQELTISAKPAREPRGARLWPLLYGAQKWPKSRTARLQRRFRGNGKVLVTSYYRYVTMPWSVSAEIPGLPQRPQAKILHGKVLPPGRVPNLISRLVIEELSKIQLCKNPPAHTLTHTHKHRASWTIPTHRDRRAGARSWLSVFFTRQIRAPALCARAVLVCRNCRQSFCVLNNSCTTALLTIIQQKHSNIN